MFKTIIHSTSSKWTQFTACAIMGFGSGLPLFAMVNLLNVWLKSYGMSLKTIAYFGFMQLPYTLKFLWAPLVDRYQLPFLGARRGWMLTTQSFLLLIMLGIGFLDPKQDLLIIAVMATCLSFFSATQDIAVDAFRREFFTDAQQGPVMAISMNSYKLAGLIPGSLALWFVDITNNWQATWMLVASFMLLPFIVTLLIDEPTNRSLPKTLQEAIVNPFIDFFTRFKLQYAVCILLFVCLYKLGDSLATNLASIFYLDMGYTKTDLALISKNAALWSSVAGGILGAIWLDKMGLFKSLWIFGIAQMLAIIGFIWLAMPSTPKTLGALAIVVATEAFTVGLASAAVGAYLAILTSRKYSASQFALFTSLAAVPRVVISGFTGDMHAFLGGWHPFFIACLGFAIPGLILLYIVQKLPLYTDAKV